jgi:hypothetical protein
MDKAEETTPGIRSSAGAVEPGQEVWVWNLESRDLQGSVRAGPDGRFDMLIWYDVGDELRVQVRSELGRSIPLDVEMVSGTGSVRAPSRSACVEVPLELDLEERSSARLRFGHQCSSAVSLVDVRWRDGSAGFAIETPSLGPLSPGETSMTIEAPASPGFSEDILFIELEVDDQPERHPVSIYAGVP